MLTIRDIMTNDVFTLSANIPVDEAAWALAQRSISGAPVRDAKGRLVGTLTRAELIDPERGAWRGDVLTRDVMSSTVLIAQAEQPAMEAVRLMMREEIQQIVVINRKDEVIGIVTPMDVMKALVRGDAFQAEPRVGMDEVGVVDDTPWETAMTA